jgi:hypothetical protein
MSAPASWQDGNEEYLSTSLARLRQRLASLNGQEVTLTSDLSKPENTSWLHSLIRNPLADSSQKNPGLSSVIAEESGFLAASDTTAAEEMEPPPALIILSRRFGLSRFEQDILLFCAAMELDTSIAGLCARAQKDQNRPYPTFALALILFDEARWDVLSPERPLRYWHLLEINQSSAQPLTISQLRADERIANFIKGLNYLDDRLAPILTPLSSIGAEVELPLSQRETINAIVNRLKVSGTPKVPVIQLLGPDLASKQMVAWHVAAALGLNVYRIPAELLPSQANEMETLARLWERESVLMPVSLYMDSNGADSSVSGLVSRFLARINGVVFLDTRDIWPGLSQSAAFEITKPTPAEQKAAWAGAMGQNAGDSPSLLAGQFNLNCASIQQIAENALCEKEDGCRLQDRIWKACLTSTRPRLDVLAQRLDPKATWDDLVLPPVEMNLLRQIAAQVENRSKVYDLGGFRRKMNRGLGIGVLFSGESGTGKTMAAEVIANELQLNLYRIDLSQVVSKYIGETEKNLQRLFDAAEDGGAILFFDEADSLFGKRSEVKDSHDRYANIEISYLLQRMEAFGGLAILATNMKSALDQAFLRRLRFTVEFPHPGPEERRMIWQKVFPTETKTNGLDYDRLARLNLTGGSIHNAALNAAFLAAAAADTPVTMQHVLDAARTESKKQGGHISEADFRL